MKFVVYNWTNVFRLLCLFWVLIVVALGDSGAIKGREKCFLGEMNGDRTVFVLWLFPVQGGVRTWLILVGLLKKEEGENLKGVIL